MEVKTKRKDNKMVQNFIIRYKVTDDIPINPDWVLKQLQDGVSMVQSEINRKNLFGEHKIELREVKEGWFSE